MASSFSRRCYGSIDNDLTAKKKKKTPIRFLPTFPTPSYQSTQHGSNVIDEEDGGRARRVLVPAWEDSSAIKADNATSSGGKQQSFLQVLLKFSAVVALGYLVMCFAVRAGSAISTVNTSSNSLLSPEGATPAAAVGANKQAAKTSAASSNLLTGSRSAPPLAPLAFTAQNFYHIRDGKPAQHYPWLKGVKLIEPHRDTTLTVANGREGFKYRWEIRSSSAGGNITATTSTAAGGGVINDETVVFTTANGAETVVVFTALEDNVITLEEVSDVDGEELVVTRRQEEKVMVKYVRREIRTLTDEEREELFDAVRERVYILL